MPVCVFQGWMRVDARGLKSALLNVIKKWSFMFKQHLVDHVTSRYAWLGNPPHTPAPILPSGGMGAAV